MMKDKYNKKYDFDLTPSDVADSWRHKKRSKKPAVAIFMSFLLLFNYLAYPVMAENLSTSKEEIIYVNLSGDGSVSGIYVVNAFDLTSDGQIIDYGDYTSLRNLSTEDGIAYENQSVKIDTKAGKFYYEGQLANNTLPWEMNISYMLDGESFTDMEIAGKSGHLDLLFSVKKSSTAVTDFFDSYALQITMQMENDNMINLDSDGATEANVGNYRQLTYTVMPGQGADIHITADVHDFQMPGTSVNAVPLSLDMDLDLENNDGIIELQEGVSDLYDGSLDLDAGAYDLQEGALELKDGVVELGDGAMDLSDGAYDLNDGVLTLLDGAGELDDGVLELLDGSSDLKDGTLELVDGVSDLVEGVNDLLGGTVSLDDGVTDLLVGANDLNKGASDLSSGAKDLYTGLATISGKNEILQTMSMTLYDKLLDEAGALVAGAGYNVSSDTTSNQLQTFMADRQSSLTDQASQDAATASAITSRITELSTIVASGSDEEKALAQPSLDYWQMTMALQGEFAYQELLAATDQITADASSYFSLHQAYENYIALFGDESTFMTTYATLDHQVGASEQALIAAAVTSALTSAVSDDPVYQTLAVLTYYKGVIDYTKGVLAATMGAGNLYSGASDLSEGTSDLYIGVAELKSGSTELLSGVQDLMDGVTTLSEGTIELNDGVITLYDGVVELKDGSTELVDGVVELSDGSLELYDGTVELYDGVMTLLDGAIELHDGTITLKDDTVELTDGVLELRDKTTTASLKDRLQKAIDEALGRDIPLTSFVSSKNTDVTFVQFAMKTPDITIPEVIYVEPVTTQDQSFIGKFLALFGL